MLERQPVIAGERKVAQRREGEGEHDLIAAGAGDRGLELGRIDVEQRPQENRERNRDDDRARRHAEAPERGAAARDRVDEARGECRRLLRRRLCDRRPVRSRASFLGLRHTFFLLTAPL